MASKGKGKSKLAKIDIEQQKKGTKQCEGALDNSYFVMARMKDTGDQSWHKARIIECRLQKDYDINKKKVDSSYEYYVHYIDHNRRMDQWVYRDQLQLTDEIIFEEPQKYKKHKKNEEKKVEQIENDEHEGYFVNHLIFLGMDEISLLQHEEVTKFKTIDWIEIGKFKCETWYYSPFPQGYHNIECLYFCEFCLAFFNSKKELQRHNARCPLHHPPGDEIYQDEVAGISMFEVDGQKNQIYCENLCYMSKLFLDHKNLYWNMDPFMFFILCENDKDGSHMVGYFSKEKESTQGWNLSCILTLPCYQRKGYGKFLVNFSYEISLIEGKVGTPERPLSDLGKKLYLSWWVQRIIDYIRCKGLDFTFSVNDLVKETGIRDQDIIWTLEQTYIIKYTQGQMSICTDMTYLNEIYKSQGRPNSPILSENIHYIPFKQKWESNMTYNFPQKDPLKDL